MNRRSAAEADASVERLARLFREHPVWQEAAGYIADGAASRVVFAHRPGEEWTLRRKGGASELAAQRCSDPDLVLRFAPGAVRSLERVRGDIADFAIALFECALSKDPDERVEIRVVAGFARLVRRGYVGLLIAAGPRLVAFGAAHGVANLAQLRRLIGELRAGPPDDLGVSSSTPGETDD